MKTKVKNSEFLLLSGYYNEKLNAIDPQIKEVIISKHNEVDKLKMEVLRLELELTKSQRSFVDKQLEHIKLQGDLINIYENYPFTIPNKQNKQTNLTIIHNHINIKDGDVIINNLS